MHASDARRLGEAERRIYLLGAWRETELFNEQERAALALTDVMTRLAETQDVSDEVYQEATRVFTEEQYRVVASVPGARQHQGLEPRERAARP